MISFLSEWPFAIHWTCLKDYWVFKILLTCRTAVMLWNAWWSGPSEGQYAVYYHLFLTYTYSVTGNYSCLKVDLIFTRDRAFYFTTVFIPGIILVTSSFITFWLEWNAVPARVMIGKLTFVFTNPRNLHLEQVLFTVPIIFLKILLVHYELHVAESLRC